MKRIIQLVVVHFSLLIFNIFPQQPGWEIISLGTTTNFNSIHFIDPFNLYICGNELLNVSSNDSGMTWQVNTLPIPVSLNDIFVIDQNTVVTVGNSGSVFRTTDGGLNWVPVTSGVTDDLLSVSFIDSFGICGARSQTILYTSNAGASWHIAQSGFVGGEFWGAVLLSPQIGFIAGENSIFQPLLGQTTDSGQNWNFTAFYLNNNEGRATGIEFTDMFIGYVSARVWDGHGAISKTTNSGSDWVTTFFTNPLWDVDFPISNASLIGYAVGDLGLILKSYDAGVNWQSQQSGTSLKLNKVHFPDLDYGFTVGENGIVLRTTTGGEPVTQVTANSSQVYDFKLEQNYPNPFNPTTKIMFTIPSSVFMSEAKNLIYIQLKVYDVLGNEVATLVNEEKPVGSYEVEWNASDLPSGIYFYKLWVGSFVETKKMVLLK